MKKNIFILATCGIVITTALFVSCKGTKQTAGTTDKKNNCASIPTYTGEIKAIMDANCAATCHSAKKKADGIDLSTYEVLKTEAVKRHFMGSIRQESGFAPMPKKAPKLGDETIQKIACWIENGMPN